MTCSILSAQSDGTIYGHVKDNAGAAVENADVFIDGTMYSVFTDANGYYELEVEPGVYILVITGIGFEEISREVSVNAGQIIEFSTQLIISSSTTQLGEAVVVGQVSKETESALLNEQRKSVVITENIGAKELERKGVSDVASAVSKVSGISKQEGSNLVFVRGLGDRYNSTTINGLPIPSNDPEFKNIDLSIFSSDIVEYIGIDKVYSGTFFGDFAGGNVNINPKNHSGKAFLKIGLAGRGNSNALTDNNFRLQTGISRTGFKQPNMPGTLSSYDFDNGMNAVKSNGIGSGFSLSAGNRFKMGEQGSLNAFLTLNFDNEYTSITDGFLKTVNLQGAIRSLDYHTYNSYSYNTNSTGMLNLNYKINNRNTVKFTSLFVNSSNQNMQEYYGSIIDYAENDDAYRRRARFVRNTLWINQLIGEHKLNDRFNFNWALGYNTIQGDMPDRQKITLRKVDGGYLTAANNAVDNHRYYQFLNENEIVGNVSVDYKFKKDEEDNFKGKLTVGYNGRMKKRDFEATQFNLGLRVERVIDHQNVDAFFNQENFQNGFFEISTFGGNSLDPQFYDGEQNIHAAFANVEYKFNPRLTAVLGLRAETVFQEVIWNTSLDPVGGTNDFDRLEFLPSLNVKYAVTEKQNLRFGASRTYTLPQFKERAFFFFEEEDGSTFGNPDLYPSQNYNLDLKWELFPTRSELISFGAFGKYIVDPMNKITVASSTNDMSFVNTGDWGHVIGAELEIRKNIFTSQNPNPFGISVGGNASYAYTNQELNGEKVNSETRLNVNFTNEEDAFQGASEWLANADVTFTKDWEKSSVMATVAYNHYSDRIFSLGTLGNGNIVEKGLGSLDLIIRGKLNEQIGINLTARNLLNPKYERYQENVAGSDMAIYGYKRGINVGLNVTYQF